jgi:DNA repair protein RecO (recombination protein O)
MASVKTKALVIREAPYQDNDKLLTLFTEKYGKQRAIARGARRRKGSLRSVTQLFSYARFMYFEGKNFANISDGTLIESFYPLRGNVIQMTLASYIAELLDDFYDFYQGDPEMLKAVTHIFYYWSEHLAQNDGALAACFQLKLMRIQGLGPVLTRCVRCGAHYEALTAFSIADGGTVCQKCVKPGDIPLDPGLLKDMQDWMQLPIKNICHKKWQEAHVQKGLDLMDRYITAQLGHPTKSYRFYKELTGQKGIQN